MRTLEGEIWCPRHLGVPWSKPPLPNAEDGQQNQKRRRLCRLEVSSSLGGWTTHRPELPNDLPSKITHFLPRRKSFAGKDL